MIESSLRGLEEKIVAMDVWHVVLPVSSRRDHGIGTIADNIECVIVRITSENGVVGFGEASPWSVFTGTPEASFAALDRYFRPLVIGARLSDFTKTMELARRIVVHCTEAKAALEAAWLDLAGKLLSKPVWALLGDKCRDEVSLSVSLANPDFDKDLELLNRLDDDKVRIVKLKTGFRDHAFDIMRLEKLKCDFAQFSVRVDYNQGLGSDAALEQVPEIDQLNPDFIEQPVVAHDFVTMARLRDLTVAPLLADESVFGPEDMHRAVREEICDGVSVKVMKSGGILRGLEVAEIAQKAGLPAYGGDMFETGLAHLAGLHMVAVCPNISLGCEFYHATFHLVEDLLEKPFPIIDGMIQVPNDAGLGMNVNVEMLDKYAICHSENCDN